MDRVVLRIGHYEVVIFETGSLWMDGGGVFGVIPKALWNQKVQADAANRVPLKTRSLLIRDAQHCLLVDTGLSSELPDKICEFYRIDRAELGLQRKITALGIDPDHIDTVVLTHLHFDHVGGAVLADKPTLPRAKFCVQRRNFTWAQAPAELDRASYQKVSFMPLYDQGRLELLEGEIEILPGIRLLISEGHTVGQQLVLVHGASQSLLFIGDLAPTAWHLNLTWGSGFDLNPLILLEEKKVLVQQAIAEKWLVVFPHDPQIALGTIVPGEKGLQVKPWNGAQ